MEVFKPTFTDPEQKPLISEERNNRKLRYLLIADDEYFRRAIIADLPMAYGPRIKPGELSNVAELKDTPYAYARGHRVDFDFQTVKIDNHERHCIIVAEMLRRLRVRDFLQFSLFLFLLITGQSLIALAGISIQ